MKTYSHETYLRGMANLSEVEDNAYAWILAERDQLRAELARLQRNEDCVQRLIVWAAENGWNGVDNAKILDSFIIGLFDELRAELAAAKEHLGIAINNAAGWRKRTAERRQKMKELAADNARLRDLLDSFEYWGAKFGVFAGTQWAADDGVSQEAHWLNAYAKDAKELLAATPAQSLAAPDAAVKVAVLREVIEELRDMARDRDDSAYDIAAYTVEQKADRIEQEAQRG